MRMNLYFYGNRVDRPKLLPAQDEQRRYAEGIKGSPLLQQSNANKVVYLLIHDPVFCRKEGGRAAIYESPCCRCRQERMDRLPVLLVLHQRSKQQKDALAQTFFCPAAAKLLPGVRVAAFDVLVIDVVVAGNGVVCIKYASHLVIHL